MKSPQVKPMDVEAAKSPSVSRRHTLLVLQVAGQRYGVSSSNVQQITAMAVLHRPPGMPEVFAGFLNLAGESIPVVRLHHLFGLPDTPLDLWTPLVILRGSDRRLALLVDKVQRIVRVNHDAVLPLPLGHVLNDCVEGIVRLTHESVLLLSPERLLLQQEAESAAELGKLVQQRLRELEGAEA